MSGVEATKKLKPLLRRRNSSLTVYEDTDPIYSALAAGSQRVSAQGDAPGKNC